MKNLIFGQVGRTLYLLAALLAVCGCEREQKPAAPKTAQERELDSLVEAVDAVSKTVVVTNYVTITNVVAAAPAPEPAADEKPAKPQPNPEPAIRSFKGNLDGFELSFASTPDLTTILDYVKVTPNPGALRQDFREWRKACSFLGDFKPRTAYTVTVRAGLPMADGRKLAQEYRRTFTTGDRPQKLEFAASGRYLPAAGRRAVALTTVNVTNLICSIRSVPTKNIVQLLAREEHCYSEYWGGSADSRGTAELAGDPVERKLHVKAPLNESASTMLPLNNGEVANGVYLVSARAENAEEEDWRNPARWRLVCVTDIGLSVRVIGSSIYVWATSLTGGRPIPGLQILVYSSNGIVQSEGATDAEGWCCCECAKADSAFAVVAAKPDGADTTFLALRDWVEEPEPAFDRRALLKNEKCEAFVWTDRGIYRHGEPILVQALLRNGRGQAPKPFPVEIELQDPEGKTVMKRTQVADAFGSVVRTDFTVADDQPSGNWSFWVRLPGKNGDVLGARHFKVEEFVPPQIRVTATPPKEGGRTATNLLFTVAGEHLFGGPAKGLPAEGAYMFEDAPFAPRGWEAFRFGDENRRLPPNFKKVDQVRLDGDGKAVFAAGFPKTMRPRAAVKMTVQGGVFEGGGRPAAARASTVLHAYPHYIGVALPDTLRQNATPKACRVVVVNPDGTPCRGARRLVAAFEQVETVYSLKKDGNSWEWKSEKIRHPLGEEVAVQIGANGLGTLAVPVGVGGDYAVTLREEETGVSFGASYWVGGAGDAAVRAPLQNPSRISLAADKKVYYPGECPRLTVKAPFAGVAWLQVMRDEMIYSQILTLTNATCEIELEPVKAAWAPGVDVALSVVQAVKPGERPVANRALGLLPIRCATRDSALDVAVKATVVCAPTGGSTVTAEIDAHGQNAVGERAVVTVVDEGINLLTDEKTPDPAGWFGESRFLGALLYDVYNRLLPILDGDLKRSGVKTGGGADGDLFCRVSPVPSRRYKPLSLWQQEVELKDGRATVAIELPEFVGEVRVTAVAYNKRATGAGSVQAKVTPNLVMQPDAPRFAAPGDEFLATMTLSNRSGAEGKVAYDLLVGGSVELAQPVHGERTLADGASETLTFPVRATQTPGQGSLIFVTEGFGEKHRNEISLPVRPAAPWVKTATTVSLKAGEKRVFPNTAAVLPETAQRTFLASGSPVAELAAALEYLVAYPYGCLEQTTSRMFPLVTAGGILNTLPVAETTAAEDAKAMVANGIRRVCGMVRAHDFVMWPDCDQAPWDREVSLWSAHFLVAASAGGFDVPQGSLDRVKSFLRTWAMSTNATTSVYACQTLALAGTPDRDRQLHWFDRRASLAALDRCRLARAFVRSGDPPRAKTVMETVVGEPADGKSAAVELLARLDLDPKDARLAGLVSYLFKHRDAGSCHWGTTEANAHVLLALGSYYRANVPSIGVPEIYLSENGGEERKISPKRAERVLGGGDVTLVNRGAGDAFVSVSSLALPQADALPTEAKGIAVSRRFLRTDGTAAAPNSFVRGEMLIVELTLSAPMKTVYSDLVIEELLPACLEPDQTPLAGEAYPFIGATAHQWLLRRELRDDRVLGFSRRFKLDAGASVKFYYPVRVVGAGTFVMPGSSVEAMYDPSLHARGASGRVKVAK